MYTFEILLIFISYAFRFLPAWLVILLRIIFHLLVRHKTNFFKTHFLSINYVFALQRIFRRMKILILQRKSLILCFVATLLATHILFNWLSSCVYTPKCLRVKSSMNLILVQMADILSSFRTLNLFRPEKQTREIITFLMWILNCECCKLRNSLFVVLIASKLWTVTHRSLFGAYQLWNRWTNQIITRL